MQVIHTATEDIQKAWGLGKPKPGRYRLLTYLLSANCDDGTLWENGITGELLLLSPAEQRQLSALPCDYAPWMDELIAKRFLVREDSQDDRTVHQLRTLLHMVRPRKDITSYTILPTTACNARCFYCYESDYQHIHMTAETADKAVAYIAAHRGDRPVSLHWFGGEPMVGMARIDQICDALRELKIPFTSGMTSNGYLFSQSLAAHAKEAWKLRRIQITLDGTETIYNQTKNYLSPDGSPYRRVLDNIGYLLDNEIRVSVRLNLGLHNAEDLFALVDELAVRFGGRTGMTAYARVLFDNCGAEPVHFNASEAETLERTKGQLDHLIRESGFAGKQTRLPKLKINRCMADSGSSVLINPAGKLGKCEHFSMDHLHGDLDCGVTDPEISQAFQKTDALPQCSACVFFPSCIRLKLCQPNAAPCTDLQVHFRQETTLYAMERAYQAFRTKEV